MHNTKTSRTLLGVLNTCLLMLAAMSTQAYELADVLDAANPIEPYDTVFIEEMTWIEVRDAIESGKTTAIIATGGIEQNGPYLSTGKHNVILKETTNRIARKLGNALVAPIVPFVPEGNLNPPSGHMRFSGTISVSKDTFKRLLRDIAESLKVHGFKNIILLGDSGGNQKGMQELADELQADWAGQGAFAHYIKDYYDNPRWTEWLEARGVIETRDQTHHDFRHTAIMMMVDPMSVRMPQRVNQGDFSVNGVNLMPVKKTLSLADELVQYQTDITVEAIEKSIETAHEALD